MKKGTFSIKILSLLLALLGYSSCASHRQGKSEIMVLYGPPADFQRGPVRQTLYGVPLKYEKMEVPQIDKQGTDSIPQRNETQEK